LLACSHGFAADLSVDTPLVYNTLAHLDSQWRSSGTKGLFDMGDTFDEDNGIFTAPVSGMRQW
jgi:hypothetical protein